MNKIKDILYYILKKYPYPDDLTKTRLTKIFYLIDWKYIKENNCQMTNIRWYFDHYGPFVSDVLDVADEDKWVRIRKSTSVFGGIKYVVEPKKIEKLKCNLSNTEKSVIDEVIKDTQDFTWNEFISYVYNTDPIKESEHYEYLDLERFI